MSRKKKSNSELENEIQILKKQHAEHLSSEIQFETIFEESRLGNKIINSDLRILRVNKVVSKMLGYSTDELLSRQIVEFSHPDYRNHWKSLQEKLWKKNSPSFSFETCILRKDGTSFWCNVTSILFLNGNETLGYTILEDISDRKAKEKIQTDLYVRKDEFLSILTHELNTPLANIKAFNQLLKRNFSEDKGLIHFIERTGYQIDRLQRLIADLLDVTKIGTDNLNLIISEFNIKDWLVETIADVQSATPTHDISLETAPEFNYRGDRFRLEQVLINLLTNAVKYSPEYSKIIVRASLEGNSIVFSIQDFGIGIPETEIEKITERFYRINKAGSKNQGLGLGLYISLGIIRKHNGRFWIRSEVGKGSTFNFSLPVHYNSL